MIEEKLVNSEMEVKTENGAQDQITERYKRPIVRAVSDGKVSISLENSLREKYGKDFVDKYKEVLKESKAKNNNDPNRRKTVINLSAIVREKENSTPTGGATVPEVPKPLEEEKKDRDPNESDKEYYLRILQRRLDLIQQKNGIKFDPELIEFFKSDEYFKNGNIEFLESYETLGKINKVWNNTKLIDNSTETIDKVAEQNKRAMDVIKGNALKYGDPSLYSSVVEDCEELDKFVEKTKKDALADEKFYNEQMIKDRVERAILGMAIKNNENENIKALAEVLIESVNKRAEYMKDEMEIKNFHRNVIVKEESAESIDDLKAVKDSDYKLVLLLNERRENRPAVFGPRVIENKEEIQEIDMKVPAQEDIVPEEMKKETYYDTYDQHNFNEPVLENKEPEMQEEHVKQKVLTLNRPYNQM